MEYILETQNLTKVYGTKEAANDISLHIREGQIYGLIGRNGAGKTTIMRMISGLSAPTSGSYSLFGKTGTDCDYFTSFLSNTRMETGRKTAIVTAATRKPRRASGFDSRMT